MTFLNVLNKFAPLKKKYLRANHSRFFHKELNVNASPFHYNVSIIE